MKTSITIRICLIGLVFFVSKATVLGQDTDIKCEVISFDLNLSGSKALSKFGKFFLFAEGKELKKRKRSGYCK